MLVKLETTNKIYRCLPAEALAKAGLSDEKMVDVQPDTRVLVEAEGIVEPAIVINPSKDIVEDDLSEATIIRQLTSEDEEKIVLLRGEARGLIGDCQKKIEIYNLPMKIVDAELSFDEKKLTFYFSADGRVDFRDLVNDLVHYWRKIIRLQQIDPREQARLIGGFGRCGQQLCCSRCPVVCQREINLEETKDIGRHMGICGRPMCCLGFEEKEAK